MAAVYCTVIVRFAASIVPFSEGSTGRFAQGDFTSAQNRTEARQSPRRTATHARGITDSFY
jgi:hypothetical protein